MKDSRQSPLILAEICALRKLGDGLCNISNLNQVERGKVMRVALIKNELEIHKLYGRPLISKLEMISLELKLPL